MTGIELLKLVGTGKKPIVQFDEGLEKLDLESADPQMMARIIGANIDTNIEGCIFVKLDFNDFEAHNKSVAKAVWWDKDHNPTLTWFESGAYPKDGIENWYLPLEEELPLHFVEEHNLLNKYVKEQSPYSYVEWLEQQLLRLRGESKSEEPNHSFEAKQFVFSEQYQQVYRIERVFSTHLLIVDQTGKRTGYSNYADLRVPTEAEIIKFFG
ncbi:hypothetical protein PP175_28510 (plasmid) [Aneurinibacillus sp. Ricciae_BoGa-3]|uniref:hypothetical protein n=1 Tax=Aneurinibacillus sp. Ricciae_BoGa-3 TaxID=3022697 RepID=UPI00233FAC6B|nr:hypothetical protein [Aneurinibacillus sp. Ricciae_BoGa-3]WCK57134.1 hypothetical protein PP175_28510 [Aneurinibacillus sp. Ricciae_BoGa-3]